jgi:predicted  nucleic acid-binding Zn-ribbon protein
MRLNFNRNAALKSKQPPAWLKFKKNKPFKSLYCIFQKKMVCFYVIKNLLMYQEKDKQYLSLLSSVENGKIRNEISSSNRALGESRQNLLALENDAKVLTAAYESSVKNLKEVFERIEQYNKTVIAGGNEDEIASAANYLTALLAKVTGYENQLEDISKRIAAKTAVFEDAKSTVVRAQKTIALLTPQYQAQRKQIEQKLAALNAEREQIGKSVDGELLEKYKHRRRGEKSNSPADIVVAISGNRCGACLFEIPLSLMHKISTDGYVICEECGKILYKKE